MSRQLRTVSGNDLFGFSQKIAASKDFLQLVLFRVADVVVQVHVEAPVYDESEAIGDMVAMMLVPVGTPITDSFM